MSRLLLSVSLMALLLAQALPARAQESQDPGRPEKESIRAYSLKVTGNGHVELKVQEKDGEKTYSADSMEEFRKKYPEVAREYRLGRVPGPDFHDFAKSFEELKRHFGEMNPGLEKFFENPERLFEALPPAQQGPDAEGGQPVPTRRLGVRLVPVGETLADQLGLGAGKGAQISDIEVGSAAEKAGLKKQDVLLKVDGQEADGVDGIRRAVVDALKKKEFDVELLRQGKKQTLKVTSPLGK